ncbi:unnamed protein product [Amoebophrya sp. A25]|nr:unnamed protein product [Amoebophrya sp. A25]|eukprot:GSA25T00014925001.1
MKSMAPIGDPDGGGNMKSMAPIRGGSGDLHKSMAPITRAGSGDMQKSMAPIGGGGAMQKSMAPIGHGGHMQKSMAPIRAGSGDALHKSMAPVKSPTHGGGAMKSMAPLPGGGGMKSMAPLPGGGGGGMKSMAPLAPVDEHQPGGGLLAGVGAGLASMFGGGAGAGTVEVNDIGQPDLFQQQQVAAAQQQLYGASSSSSSAAGLLGSHVPHYARQDAEIQQLCDLYQQQLVELNACHTLLLSDQERLSQMLLPYVNASGQLVMEAADPAILMFKDGLELRLAEFKEDCKRIQQLERRLQAKIDSAVAEYEHTVQDVSNVADGRILKRLREQQRLIDLQQAEIDEIRHEKNCLQAETQRLRELTKFGHYTDAIDSAKMNKKFAGGVNAREASSGLLGGRDEDLPKYPSAHLAFHGKIPHNETPWAKRADPGPGVLLPDSFPRDS